jgi:uncharacterized protein
MSGRSRQLHRLASILAALLSACGGSSRESPPSVSLDGVDLLRSQCDQGGQEACTELGIRLAEGDGVARDHAAANDLFHRACGAGVLLGCANEGLQLYHGLGVAQDDYASRLRFFDACVGGLELGCYLVAEAAYNDTPSARRPEEVVRRPGHPADWYPLMDGLCSQGDGNACTVLGDAYQRGEGVAYDLPRAWGLYETGCAIENPSSCSRLGVMLRRGFGRQPDFAEAARLFAIGCRGNNSAACNNLGGMYQDGEHGVVDRNRVHLLPDQGLTAGWAA